MKFGTGRRTQRNVIGLKAISSYQKHNYVVLQVFNKGIKTQKPLCKLFGIGELLFLPLPRIGVMAIDAAQRAPRQKDDRAHTRSVDRAEGLQAVYVTLHCYIASWKVRLITSFCCSSESLWKLTA